MFIFLGLIAQGYSQDKKATLKLSISEAQEFALQNNRTVQSAKIDIKSAEKKVWENLATGLPQVNVAANYLHQFVVPELSLGFDVRSLPDGIVTKQDLLDATINAPKFPLGVKDY
jgi:outer membrane protein TolC